MCRWAGSRISSSISSSTGLQPATAARCSWWGVELGQLAASAAKQSASLLAESWLGDSSSTCQCRHIRCLGESCSRQTAKQRHPQLQYCAVFATDGVLDFLLWGVGCCGPAQAAHAINT